jgi:ABC-type multidrug transport system ATPase subunit
MKAIMGLIRPSKGKVFVKGKNVQHNPLTVKQSIGYLPSDLQFFLDTPCKESLYHFGILKGLSRKETKKEIKRLLEMVGLSKWDDLPPKYMSSGMKQRFSLAMTIIGDPEIILFDEPVSFIDVQGKMKIYQLVQQYVEDSSKTIIMATHNVQEAMVMSDRIIVIDRGQIITEGDISEVLTKRCRAMEIILSTDPPSRDQIELVTGYEDFDMSGRKIVIKSDDALQKGTNIVNNLRENAIQVFSFRPLIEQKRMENKGE